jgi:hypothetical protein
MSRSGIDESGKGRIGTATCVRRSFEPRSVQLPRREFLQSFLAAGLLNAGPSLKLVQPSRAEKISKPSIFTRITFPPNILICSTVSGALKLGVPSPETASPEKRPVISTFVSA